MARSKSTEDESNPGYYSSKFFLKPHYQLEGLTVSLRLVSKAAGRRLIASLKLVFPSGHRFSRDRHNQRLTTGD